MYGCRIWAEAALAAVNSPHKARRSPGADSKPAQHGVPPEMAMTIRVVAGCKRNSIRTKQRAVASKKTIKIFSSFSDFAGRHEEVMRVA